MAYNLCKLEMKLNAFVQYFEMKINLQLYEVACFRGSFDVFQNQYFALILKLSDVCQRKGFGGDWHLVVHSYPLSLYECYHPDLKCLEPKVISIQQMP